MHHVHLAYLQEFVEVWQLLAEEAGDLVLLSNETVLRDEGFHVIEERKVSLLENYLRHLSFLVQVHS